MSEILVSQVMPVVQFGTYKLKGEDCYRSVRGALESGYRGLDTASVYDNEKEVGRAILDSGVPRDQVREATATASLSFFSCKRIFLSSLLLKQVVSLHSTQS